MRFRTWVCGIAQQVTGDGRFGEGRLGRQI
jgi:hypothetical protein